MKRSNVFGIALLAMLLLSALTASGAWASTDPLVLLYNGEPAPVGETAYGGLRVDECLVLTEGALTANRKRSDTAAFSTNHEEHCEKAGYSITGVVKSAKLSAKGTMSFRSTITLGVPGPCNYSITKYRVPFDTNGKEATDGEGSNINARLSKTGSSKSCAKHLQVPFSAILLNHEDGLYGTETASSRPAPQWWVEDELLVGSEPIAEETKVIVPFKLEFKAEGTKAVTIECTTEKIKEGLIEGPASRSEEAEIFEGCEVVGEEAACSVASSGSPAGTIATNPLKAKLEGKVGAATLKFAPASGETIATFEIKEISSACAEKNFKFRVGGEMKCGYREVKPEKSKHRLEFTTTSGSKVEVEGTNTLLAPAGFEVTDAVSLSSGKLWSAR